MQVLVSDYADTEMAAVLAAELGKPLLKLFADSAEAARAAAVQTWQTCLCSAPDAVLQLLPYAMPVLEERLHCADVLEPSEELRLSLMQVGLAGICNFVLAACCIVRKPAAFVTGA